MRFLLGAAALVAVIFAPAVHGAPPVSPHDMSLRDVDMDLAPRASTCNTPSNRACWTTGFDISTDYETSTPVTGVTRTYTLTITEVDNWVGPDGVTKEKVMLINNKILGPTITADWGDRIQVTVINNLRTNGTSIHWHGLRQLGSNLHDGANGLTECPIPPNGGSKVYSFLATQYGTSWYHSHFSAQYGNGVVGTILINGPASLPYDIDLGTFPLSDYYYETADKIVLNTATAGPPPSSNVLFNGTNVHPVTGQGQYANVTLTPGKRHRLRLINTSVENHFQVSLVGHSMTIIASDLVPQNAMTVQSLFIAVGQRYDVTIDASQAVGNYWFNVTFGGSGFCGTSQNPTPAAIFHYAGASGQLPTNPGTAPADSNCLDLLNLTPVVTRTVPVANFAPQPNNTIPIHLDNSVVPFLTWKVNGSAINVQWEKPVIDYILTGNTSYPAGENIIQVNSVNQWAYWLIENDPTGAFSLPHPIHLHGHDFVILGRSPDATPASQTQYIFNPSTDIFRLNGNNPARRDVAMLPAKGWLLLAFQTDNPGAWLMHCHIAWHVSHGLSVDFLERPTDLKNSISAADQANFNNNCANWRAYWPSQDPFPKVDSGLRMRDWGF
ncbi:laccase [Diplogelasinospora grovesii]|uniref:laccase n=1 Tax=Diplogelasinospora grovesii TaxID=303347 RepID=A0AAN6N0U2_9PEZI|nr:laccase [Diplogelasinospora grovesii]